MYSSIGYLLAKQVLTKEERKPLIDIALDFPDEYPDDHPLSKKRLWENRSHYPENTTFSFCNSISYSWDIKSIVPSIVEKIDQLVIDYGNQLISDYYPTADTLSLEGSRISRYPPGTFYQSHTDAMIDTEQKLRRKVSIVARLMSAELGGDFGIDRISDAIYMEPGDVIIFPCVLGHGVSMVEQGQRICYIAHYGDGNSRTWHEDVNLELTDPITHRCRY